MPKKTTLSIAEKAKNTIKPLFFWLKDIFYGKLNNDIYVISEEGTEVSAGDEV